MNQLRFSFLNLIATVILAATATVASAQQTVTFVENTTDPALAGLGAGGYVDIFYTQSPGGTSEYLNHDLIVNATTGGILDPIRGSGGGQADGTGASVDTWTHTVFEIFSPNSSSYVFTPDDPVGSFPTFVGDPLPATSLNWSVFDTNTGDTDALAPYHLARVLYSSGGEGTIDFLAFDQVTVGGGGENFSTTYGGTVVPEPTTIGLAALGFCGLATRRRRRRNG